MCNHAPIHVSRDFIAMMRQMTPTEEGRANIDHMLASVAPDVVFALASSCMVENWLFHTSQALYEGHGVIPYKMIEQDAEGRLLLTREGCELLHTLQSEERTTKPCHPDAN